MAKEIVKNCLKIDTINKTYKRGSVLANTNISTSFYPNQIVALIGHNGAGKTTLLNQICGNTKPDNGDIIYRGISLKDNPKLARTLISTMPQLYAPISGVTLKQSILSILHIRGITGNEAKAQFEKIASDLDILKWENSSGDKLSGGLQRLTSFAMAVVSPPPIILLDEPTNDVDPIRRKYLWEHMRKLAQNGHIVIVVTHNLLEVEQYTDRYIMLDKGKVIQDMLIKEAKKEPILSILSIVMANDYISDDYPKSIDVKHIKDTMQIIFTLSLEQITDAMKWVLDMVNNKNIIKYKLETETLDMLYGGLINE